MICNKKLKITSSIIESKWRDAKSFTTWKNIFSLVTTKTTIEHPPTKNQLLTTN
jgi:hypothetical protein